MQVVVNFVKKECSSQVENLQFSFYWVGDLIQSQIRSSPINKWVDR